MDPYVFLEPIEHSVSQGFPYLYLEPLGEIAVSDFKKVFLTVESASQTFTFEVCSC